MGDSSFHTARTEMQSLVLQPFPRKPPLDGLPWEHKIAYAAGHLQQHEQSMKDKIRETALSAQVYASEESGPIPFPQHKRQEPRPEDLRAAMRVGWKNHKPRPVITTSRRSLLGFGVSPSTSHVGIAKRGIEELDSYDAQFQPTMSAIQRAQDSRNTDQFPGTNGVPTPIASAFRPSTEVGRAVNYDATKDPRVRDLRAAP